MHMAEAGTDDSDTGCKTGSPTLQLEVSSEPFQAFQLVNGSPPMGSSPTVERLTLGNVVPATSNTDTVEMPDGDNASSVFDVETVCTHEGSDNIIIGEVTLIPGSIGDEGVDGNNYIVCPVGEGRSVNQYINATGVAANDGLTPDYGSTEMKVVVMNGTENQLLSSGSESQCISEGTDNIVSHSVTESSETLTSGMLVVLNGENCILELDAASGHYIAYPAQVVTENSSYALSPTKIDWQRDSLSCSVPHKKHEQLNQQQKVESSSTDGIGVKLSEQENNAAEGLLGLADSQETSTASPLKIDLLSKSGNGAATVTRLIGHSVITQGANVTDNISGSTVINGQVPLVPSDKFATDEVKCALKAEDDAKDHGGQIVFASSNRIQNFLASLGLPVKRGRGRPRRNPLPPNTTLSTLLPAASTKSLPYNLPSLLPKPTAEETHTSIIIEQEDGTEKHIVLSTPVRKLMKTASAVASAESEIDSKVDNGEPEVVAINDPGAAGDGSASVSDAASETTTAVDSDSAENKGTNAVPELSPGAQFVFVVKKEPAKIGLRATERDLAKLKCAKCEYQAYYAQQLQQHLNDAHTDELSDLMRCKCCSFLCFDEETLTGHFKASHPKCICTECNFISEHPYVVKRHMQRHDVNGCECNICGRRYKDQYILKMHVKMRHMEPDVLFQCNICSKLFNRKAHLKRHLRIHNPDKPYKCPHCDYRGCERSDITKHILIHETPRHACDVCGKSFRHIKNKELHMKRHRGQRDYKCVCCDFYGYTFTDIRKHQERKHAGLVHSVVCNVCGGTFKSEQMLQIHRQTGCQMVAVHAAAGVEADTESSELIQYVAGGSSAQLQMDGADLVHADGQVVIRASRVSIEQLADEGLGLMEVQMADDESLSVAGADQIMETSFISDASRTSSLTLLHQ